MKFLFPFFSFLHVFRRQRSETQVVMQLGIDGFQLGFLLFFFLVTPHKFCWDWAILTWGNEMDLWGERVLSLFFLLAMFSVLLFISFTIFSWGFFFSIQGAHTRKKESFIHIYPALLIVGSFMVHDVCFFLCIMNGRLGGFFSSSLFLFHSCVSGLIGFFFLSWAFQRRDKHQIPLLY